MKFKQLILGGAALTVVMMLLTGCFSVLGQRRESTSSGSQSVRSASSEDASQSDVSALLPPQSTASAPASSQSTESTAPAPAATTREVAVGNTITTANMEVTIGYAIFTNRVDARKGSSILSSVWQSADEGKILLDVSVYIKNLQQTTFTGTDVLTVTADYNSGYTYGNAIEAVESAGDLKPTSSFLGTSVKIDPLETIEVRYVIDCPQEVAENTDAPLFLTITVEGVKYKLVIR